MDMKLYMLFQIIKIEYLIYSMVVPRVVLKWLWKFVCSGSENLKNIWLL
jgi:hypothetical protein